MRAIKTLSVCGLLVTLAACGRDARGPGDRAAFPVSDTIVEARLPGVSEDVLPNGLRLMVLEDHRLPKVTFRMVVPGAGGCFDPEGKEGLAGITASLLSAGTRRMDRRAIAREMERTAASVRVSASSSSTDAVIDGDCLAESFPEILRLTSALVLEPTFPAEELEQTRVQALAYLAQQRSDPNFLARERFLEVIYEAHPGSRLALDPEAVKRITQSDVAAFHRSRYVPDHAILGIAGDVTPEEVRSLVAEGLGAWGRSRTSRPVPPPLGPAAQAGIHVVHRPHSVQTVFFAGARGVCRTDPDFLRLFFLNQVLGSNSSRRLFQNLRERHAYTYGCYSYVTFPEYTGTWAARTDVRTEVTEAALREILSEIGRVREESVPEDEMRTVKRMTAGEYALSMESAAGILERHMARRLYGLPDDYWAGYSAGLKAMAPADVVSTAAKYLAPEAVQIVAVGDAEKIVPVLKAFGQVEVRDTEGRPLAGF